MYLKSDNIENMINDKADKLREEIFQSLFLGITLDWKHQREVVISYFIVI